MKVRLSHAAAFALGAIGAHVIAGLLAGAAEEPSTEEEPPHGDNDQNAVAETVAGTNAQQEAVDSDAELDNELQGSTRRRSAGLTGFLLDHRAPVRRRAPGERSECSVCLCAMRRNSRIRVTPCGHRFHASCLESWVFYAADRFNEAVRVGSTRAEPPCCPNCQTDLRVVTRPIAPVSSPRRLRSFQELRAARSSLFPEHILLEDATARAMLEAEMAAMRARAFAARCPAGSSRRARAHEHQTHGPHSGVTLPSHSPVGASGARRWG